MKDYAKINKTVSQMFAAPKSQQEKNASSISNLKTRLEAGGVDVSKETDGRNAVDDYNKINEELKKYSEKLSTLPQIVVLTKADLLPEEELKERIKIFEQSITKNSSKKPLILTISSVTQKGLENLKNVVWNHLEKIPKSPPIEVEVTDFDKRDKTSINITRKDDASFEVTGGYVDNLIRGIVLSDFNSFSYFQMRLKRDGVIEKLKDMGMKDGDLVRIKDIEFVYED